MGAQQSKDELLYQQVVYGNVEGIKALRRDGAGLEWIDQEGKTPLITACMRPELLQVVKVLIDLGANVNAYRPGSLAGTALHHAAKKGLVQTVELLLSHGANPLVMNDDCKTALDLARAKGHWNVVRLIETRICIFAGWLRETHGPSILEAIIRQWVSRKIWAVILPCDSRNSTQRPKYELTIYPDLQASQPDSIIPLWKAHVEEPAFNQPDPALVVVDKTTKKRFKFLSGNEGDKQQLQVLYNACKGVPQHNSYLPAAPAFSPMPNTSQLNPQASVPSAGAPQSASEDVDLAMAINASIQSAIAEGVPISNAGPVTGASNSSGWGTSSGIATHNGWGPPVAAPPSKVSTVQLNESNVDPYNGWGVPGATLPGVGPSGNASHSQANRIDTPVVNASTQEAPPMASFPSAPPVAEETFYAGPIHYPSIDSSPVDVTMSAWEVNPGSSEAKEGSSFLDPIDLTVPASEIKMGTNEAKEGTSDGKEGRSMSGLCVICFDAPAEAACIPCGHVAGCMSCMKEIKAKKWGCPVCRTNIDQVIKLYAV